MRNRTIPTVLALGALIIPFTFATAASAATETATVVVYDTMTRNVASGLGKAPDGTTYELSAGSKFSVSSGTVKVADTKPGSSSYVRPAGLSLVDSSQAVTFALPQLPKSGSGVYLSLQSRLVGASYYQVQARVDPKGVVLLQALRVNNNAQTSLGHVWSTGLKVTPGMPFILETKITGTTSVSIEARVSAVGAKPTAWALAVKDTAAKRLATAGRTGVRVYVSSSSPAQTVLLDNLNVAKLTAAAPVAPPVTVPPVAPPVAPPVTVPPVTPPVAPPVTPPVVTPPAAAAGSMPNWSTAGARVTAGAAPIGSTSYQVPAGAVFVSPTGKDSAAGTVGAPFATIQRAIDRAASGATIVLRGGSYHQESVVPAGKKITIQSYPGEAVWLDGSEKLTGWAASGNAWVVNGWNHNFDSTPSFTKGESDGTAAAWRWLHPDRPMAAHPEQVWVGGEPLKEVQSLAQVKAGTFFTDTASKRLYIGSNPTGKEVKASTLTKALSLRGDGAVVRGVGVRGYATSAWMMGAVTVEAPNATLENVAIYDNATTGLFIGAANAKLNQLTIARNGLMGIGGNYADKLNITGLLAVENNSEGFNHSPVSGGLKLAKSQGLTVTGSVFLRNGGPGLWTDQSVSDIKLVRNDFIGNTGAGVFLELSHRVDFINNLVVASGGNGVKINNTGSIQFWNNTIVGGNRAVNIVQDSRSSLDPSVPGHDKRRPIGDPNMPWKIKDITLGNNVIAQSSGNCTLCVEDYTFQNTPAELNLRSDGNLIQRTSPTNPSWVVIWSRGKVNPNPYVFSTFGEYVKTTGQDTKSVGVDSRAVTDTSGRLLPAEAAKLSGVAQAVPSNVASMLGTSSATVGAIFP